MRTSPPNTGEAGAARQAADLTEPVSTGQRAGLTTSWWQRADGWLTAMFGPVGWPAAVYVASRLLLLIVGAVAAVVSHRPADQEPFLFDGAWYLRLAEHGYPAEPLHVKSTLGFFPLYPMAVRAVAWLSQLSVPRAALLTSAAGGLAAAILVQRLAAAWWGERTARRVTVVFCLFPGTIVFSMAYSEGLMIPLALGCLYALHARRWLIAGLLAGLATAVEPVALVLVPVCLAAAVPVWRQGWRHPEARRALAAPLLSVAGIGGFAVFLWAWTGTPFAAYLAQHYGWHQQNEPLALAALPTARHLASHPGQLASLVFSWNVLNGVLGGVFLAVSIRALLRARRELGAGALVLPIAMAAVTLWSVLTPPNARMTLVAFPAVMVWGRRLAGRGLGLFIAAEALALVLTSALTFSGRMLP